MTISKSQILDLSKEILETEINKNSSFIVSEFDRIIPIFELDHEVILLEVQKSKLEFNGEINLPFASILNVYPLTERAKNLLSGKLNQSIEISAPIFEGIIEQVKLIRSINSRKLLFNKLTKICLIQENPNLVFSQNVQSIVELLLKSQSIENSYLANLIQYNYNPNEISSGNIEFLEKIGIIAWITTKSSSEGYTTSNYFQRCEEFKSKINEGNYVAGFKAYLEIIEDQSSDFKNSHDKINEIINEEKIEIDLFKVSYYFLALKTKLNKNNSNLLELFEEMITDVHSDNITMAYVLYLISFSFSFEQLYESIHILEKSVLLKSKFIVRDTQTIFSALENEKIKLIKEEEERIRLLEEERLKTEAVERNRLIEEEQLNAEAEEKIRLEQEQQLKTDEEIELDAERIKMLIQSHTPVDDMESSSDSNLSENKNEEIEIGKTIELDPFDNSEKVNVQDLKDSDDPTKNENEGSDHQETSTEVSEPSSEYQNSDNKALDNNNEIEETELNKTAEIINASNEQKDDEINNMLKDSIIPVEKSNNGKLPKTRVKKINKTIDTSGSPEITFSETDDSIVQNSEIIIEQSKDEESTTLTVEIFEPFLLEFLKSSYQNKEKVKLWNDLMSKYFNEPSMEITFDMIMAQTKLKPFFKESMFESDLEIKKIEEFFKNHNQ
jgi:hypothetical protein